jgi:hypothetical protein
LRRSDPLARGGATITLYTYNEYVEEVRLRKKEGRKEDTERYSNQNRKA